MSMRKVMMDRENKTQSYKINSNKMLILLFMIALTSSSSPFSSLPTVAIHFAHAAEKVVLTQIVHRHGARGPVPPVNTSYWCPPKSRGGCGQLTDEGKLMLVQLGRYLRKRYTEIYPTDYFTPTSNDNGAAFGGVSSVVNAEAMVVAGGNGTGVYDFNIVYSRSTQVPRTMQSAEALLAGLFPNKTRASADDDDGGAGGFYPVNFVWPPKGRDTLLSSDGWPAYYIPLIASDGQYFRNIQSVVDAQFPDKSAIAALAVEARFDGFCASVSEGHCLNQIQDIAAAVNAMGTLSSYPFMAKYFKQLTIVGAAYSQQIWGFDRTGSGPNAALDKERGSPGQPLAQTMVESMREAVSQKRGIKQATAAVTQSLTAVATSSSLVALSRYSIMHYSAHDSTVAPFGVTVLSEGAIDENNYMPVFGAAYIIDLIYDDGDMGRVDKEVAAGGNAHYYVRGVRAIPEQVPGPHEYTITPLGLGGIDAGGRRYYLNTTVGRMPLDDFIRYVDSSAPPKNSRGMCTVRDSVLASSTVQCDRNGPAPTSACRVYRTACGDFACPKGSALVGVSSVSPPVNAASSQYACAPVSATADSDDDGAKVRVATMIIVTPVAGLVGMLIGAVILWRVGKIRSLPSETVLLTEQND